MKYQKIANFLDSALNEPSKIRTRSWVKIWVNANKWSNANLCDYADAYILLKGTITITGAGDDDTAKRLDERNKSVIFKNCASVTKCIRRINNTEIDIDPRYRYCNADV